ncbi:MAG: hypothetical protein JO040_06845 [Gemmatimonadetes bacterium]|nr:hypothetical protein [Gemmatimonadota bacterium]
MSTESLKQALEHLQETRRHLLDAGVSPTGQLVRDTEALLRQLALFTEVSGKRAA